MSFNSCSDQLFITVMFKNLTSQNLDLLFDPSKRLPHFDYLARDMGNGKPFEKL